MRSLVLVSAALILIAAGLSVTSAGHQREASATASPAAPQAQTPDDGVRRVTVEELRAALEKGGAVVVDVRNAEQYKAGHIKGAILIPGDEIASRAKELPKDKLIVTYCS